MVRLSDATFIVCIVSAIYRLGQTVASEYSTLDIMQSQLLSSNSTLFLFGSFLIDKYWVGIGIF